MQIYKQSLRKKKQSRFKLEIKPFPSHQSRPAAGFQRHTIAHTHKQHAFTHTHAHTHKSLGVWALTISVRTVHVLYVNRTIFTACS